MATQVFKLAPCITCHAWNGDRSMVAICPNNNEVWIYSNCANPDVKQWKKEFVLAEHDLLVSGIDWSGATNKIVTCSHDRNAFVWTFAEGEWKPSLVILRINRAALTVKWSHDGQKFAVGSGAKCVPVCHYEEENDWWISKMIKKHKSSVTCVAWHPSNQLLATGSSDFKCRIFSAFIGGVDDADAGGLFGDLTDTFGECLAEFDGSNGWINGVAWSPSGLQLGFAGHDASVSVVRFSGEPNDAPASQTIKLKGLPMACVLFLSEDRCVAGGHDFNPAVFTSAADDGGAWALAGRCEVKSAAAAASTKKSSFANARGMWAAKTSRGQTSADRASDKTALWTKHENCVTDAQVFSVDGAGCVDRFTTTGLDGRLTMWSWASIAKNL